MSERISTITLDERSIKKRSMEAEHEKTVAITDLITENYFEAQCMKAGPYDVRLSVEEGRLILDVRSPALDKESRVSLSIQPLKRIIRDYFFICESYYEALKNTGPSKLEAIDMGRRGIHNEGSEVLKTVLDGRITVDFQTARRLFTLICVLHIK